MGHKPIVDEKGRACMFARARKQHIIDTLARQDRVEVSQLSCELRVSEVTIRKDLEQLEQLGVLIRTHGGAVLKEQAKPAPGDVAAKPSETIARILPYIVNDGDLIYLGTQNICTAIARHLRNKNSLSVITNNISAAVELGDNPEINIIVPGGQMTRRGGLCTVTGVDATTFLASKHVDKAIISADGIRLSTGYSVQEPAVAQIYREIVQRADSVIVAVESEYFNKNAVAEVCPLAMAHVIVSDKSMPEDYMQRYYDNGIKVFTSYDLDNL